LTPVLFIGATILTLKEKAYVDGLDEYGFPFRFYTYTYCKSKECLEQTGFRTICLIFDILITATVAFLLAKAKEKFTNRQNKGQAAAKN
jgi:hypothetical protein